MVYLNNKPGRYMGVVLKEETYQALKQLATKERRTLSSFVRLFIEDCLAEKYNIQPNKNPHPKQVRCG
jgi:hypothetical protein